MRASELKKRRGYARAKIDYQNTSLPPQTTQTCCIKSMKNGQKLHLQFVNLNASLGVLLTKFKLWNIFLPFPQKPHLIQLFTFLL